MILDLGRIAPGGETLTGEEAAPLTDLGCDEVRAETPVRYRLQVDLPPGEVVVRGALACTVVFLCSRCGKPFRTEVRAPDFLRVFPCRDPGMRLDLTEDMREDIILAFPTHPVCGSGCRGVCPRCGADLNEKDCGCTPGPAATGWGKLDQMNITE